MKGSNEQKPKQDGMTQFALAEPMNPETPMVSPQRPRFSPHKDGNESTKHQPGYEPSVCSADKKQGDECFDSQEKGPVPGT